MSGFVVLASYPKSGNTWMRAFLGSLAHGGRVPDINAELSADSFSWRSVFDSWIGMESSDLTTAEIAAVRPYVSCRAAARKATIIKVHDANVAPPGAREPPYPADSIDRVIYIVRDPRDVAVSAIHQYGKSIEAMIEDMNNAAFGTGYSRYGLTKNVPQFISTWSRHVESWLDAPDLRIHLVRYEDMATAPERTFSAAAKFLDLGRDPHEVARAIAAVSFQNLARQEDTAGFRETTGLGDAPFFRRGQAGGWRDELSPELAQRIVRAHSRVMQRLGYLD